MRVLLTRTPERRGPETNAEQLPRSFPMSLLRKLPDHLVQIHRDSGSIVVQVVQIYSLCETEDRKLWYGGTLCCEKG
jgi:hypothetical protein